MKNNDSKYKVIYRGHKLSGGSPKSAYQYLKELKDNGFSVSVITTEGEKTLENLYRESFDELVLTDNISALYMNRNITGLYRQLNNEYKRLKKEKPDLILILGHPNAYFYSHFCNVLGIPAVTLIAGGDVSTGIDILEGCPCDHVICFSEENRDVLLSCIDNEKITVIPNRIKLKSIFENSGSHYFLSEDSGVNILFTSRISGDKYDSITSFIALADKIADNGRKINVTIAGDGDCMPNLKEFVGGIDNSNLNIKLKGHVDDLIPEFEKAHIVVGKGRSVIEPIMMNRIGCVMGNDGKIEVCRTDNFEHLYHYNFSGRNLDCDNSECVLKTLVDSIISGTFDTQAMLAASDITRKYYSSEYLADKFRFVLDNIKCEKQRKKKVSVLGLILKLFWIKFSNKLRKGKKK